MPALVRSLLSTLVAAALSLTAIATAAGTLRMAITRDEGTLTPYTYQTGSPGCELMTLVYDQLFLLGADLIP